MSPAVVALCLVVIVIGGTLVVLWALIDKEAELESRPLTAPAPEPPPREHYVGARRYGGPAPASGFRPPSPQRIEWLGSDSTAGFWIWKDEPPETL
jgi:hypothetical protein